MSRDDRRTFLADVGRGMLVAGVGPALAAEMGLAPAYAEDTPGRLTFGDLEPLVSLMQQTPVDKLLPAVVAKMKGGVDLKRLTAAAALANARTFGGNDYTGYHAFMALAPSLDMTEEMPAEKRALPALKVFYRNTDQIQKLGGAKNEKLHPVEPADIPSGRDGGELLRAATRSADEKAAERTFAALMNRGEKEAFEDLQAAVRDHINVHRVVLSWRAWETLDIVGREQAHTLLRQSVRFCIDEEQQIRNRGPDRIRTLLPKLMDQHKLAGKSRGDRRAEDAWVKELASTILKSDRSKAAEAVAAALGEGFSTEDVGEAISLAANQLVLRDPGRTQAQEGKPIGSIHGASVGVHASDSANAWRHIARVGSAKNAFASLIVGAYHTAGQIGQAGADPYPWAEHLETVTSDDPDRLTAELDAAVRDNDQGRACAVVQRCAAAGVGEKAIYDVLLPYAVSEDGALHAEKYYRTVREEFEATRPAFRWGHLVGLARVTASEHGFPAPGYREACELLGV